MTSLRHKTAIAYIRHDAHRLSPAERAQLGLPAHPRRRQAEPPPFPSAPAEYVWFALTTKPQGEARAVHALGRMGFAAFNPTETVLARSSRMVKFKRKERERAILTSMVLAGFRGQSLRRMQGGSAVEVFHADVPWLHVLQASQITGVIGMGDGPVPVPVGNVVALHDRCGQRAAPRNGAICVGDAVEVSFGAFQGQAGQVVALVNDKASVQLFGEQGLLQNISTPLTIPEAWVRVSATAAQVDKPVYRHPDNPAPAQGKR